MHQILQVAAQAPGAASAPAGPLPIDGGATAVPASALQAAVPPGAGRAVARGRALLDEENEKKGGEDPQDATGDAAADAVSDGDTAAPDAVELAEVGNTPPWPDGAFAYEPMELLAQAPASDPASFSLAADVWEMPFGGGPVGWTLSAGVLGIGAALVHENKGNPQGDDSPAVVPPDTTPPQITGPGGAAGAASSAASIAENGSAVHTFSADEPVIWSLSGGADAAHFSIDANTGALIFQNAPDFEAPADDNADNTYIVTVRATDGVGNASEQTVTISVTNVNDNAPVITSSDNASFAENGTGIVYTVTAVDADNLGALTYSLGGEDAEHFNIDASTGEVTFKNAPNYEDPWDAEGLNSYHITVTASDGLHTSDAYDVTITVTNVGEAGEGVIDLGALGQLIHGVQVEGKWYYVLDGNRNGNHSDDGAYSDRFSHDELDAIFRYDINGVEEVETNKVGEVGKTDNTYRYAILNGVHVALPTYGGPMNGINAGWATTDLHGTAVNSGSMDNSTYDDLLAIWDAHNGNGTGTGSSGWPTNWASTASYWSATPWGSGHTVLFFHAGYINTYRDGFLAFVALQVLDNTAPIFLSGTTASVAENISTGTVVYDADANDGDGSSADQWVSYSLGGVDAAHFNIDASTGEVRFTGVPDYENPMDEGGDNVYNITVIATDVSNNKAQQDVAITVAKVDRVSFAENGTGIVYTATVVDADNPGALTYSLSGVDEGFFNIDASTGEVTFKTAPDYENPMDEGGDNVYNITVIATDVSNNKAEQAVTISVTNVNDNAPVITSSESASFAENGTGIVYTATAVDADNLGALTYSLDGEDAEHFNIDASTGEVTFKSAPDYESPWDAAGLNSYHITVTASDGLYTAYHDVAITVTDVVDAGDSVIDLGAYGKLINGVQVEGSWYYVWDRDGNGSLDDNDRFNHNELDAIFRRDINGVEEYEDNKVGNVGDTDNTYRYATLNGVHVALPTYGGAVSGINASPVGSARSGTSVHDGSVDNPTYDDLLAIWDAYNGDETAIGGSGMPSSDWDGGANSYYWSATPSNSGHAMVGLHNGVVHDRSDSNLHYVALHVL